jgi:hypothetical protein
VPQRVCQSVRGTETFLEFIGGTILLSDCQFKGHPVAARLIEELHQADRGITPTLSKEYWLLTRQLIPVGSGKSQIYKFLSVKINGIPFHA